MRERTETDRDENIDMRVSEQDLERLELYLDHELSEAEARELDGRLAAETTLAGELERLRGQRSTRLAAMSTAFDTDAAAVERLVASVRMAKASEALQMRRRSLIPSWLPMRSVVSAAACVTLGLLLGVTLQRQHGVGAGGMLATPMTGTSTGSMFNSDASLGNGGGVYVVSVKNATGREVMRVRFPTQEQAQQFIDHINRRSDDAAPLNIGDAHILDQPY